MGGPYRAKFVEFGESVFAHLREGGKGSGQKMVDRWKSAVWLGKSVITDEHLVRTDEGIVYARSVRLVDESSKSEENLRAVVETPQKPKTTIVDIPLAAEPLALLHAPQEVPEDEKEEPTAEPEKDEEMQGVPSATKETPGVSSSGTGERRTETQDNMSVKKRAQAAVYTCFSS